MSANQAELPLRTMCRVLKVSASGFHDWQGRAPSATTQANVELVECIRRIHAQSDATYGMPRIRAQLLDEWVVASRKRIARLMRREGLRGVSRRRGFTVTTERDRRQRPAPDLVQRQFTAQEPDELWVADMTYIPTWAGFIYLAMVLDACSRKVVGWAMGERMTSELVIAALDMALQTRKPEGVIHHSDQGSQYTSVAFGSRCKQMGVRPSMGTVGDAYDNAMAESFFATLECELIARRVWKSKAEAKVAVFTWIEGWYNPRRRHSALGHQSPMIFESKRNEERVMRASHPEHGLHTASLGSSQAPTDAVYNPAVLIDPA
jgi:putative transposase